MFNLGPMELVVLAIVGIVVIGPEKLPGLAKDAAALLRTVRDLATGARQQLRDELGPEFADIDFRNLNPRTAMQRMVFGDDSDFSKLNPRTMMRDAVLGDDTMDDLRDVDPRTVVRDTAATFKKSYYAVDEPSSNGHGPVHFEKRTSVEPPPDRPRPRPRPASSYDDDVT